MTSIKVPKITRQAGKDNFYIVGLITSSNEAIEVYDTKMVVVVIEKNKTWMIPIPTTSKSIV